MTNINHSMAAKNNAMVLKCAPTTWSVWRSVRVLVLVLVLVRMGWVFFFVFGFFLEHLVAFGERLRGRSGNGSFSHFIVTENCVYKFDFGSKKKKKLNKA